jgi:hypothetical protein
MEDRAALKIIPELRPPFWPREKVLALALSVADCWTLELSYFPSTSIFGTEQHFNRAAKFQACSQKASNGEATQ